MEREADHSLQKNDEKAARHLREQITITFKYEYRRQNTPAKTSPVHEAKDLNAIGWEHYKNKKYAEALEAFQQSANQHDKNGYYFLGFMHEFGYGVEKNIEKAQEYYEVAAKKGHKVAQLKLRWEGPADKHQTNSLTHKEKRQSPSHKKKN